MNFDFLLNLDKKWIQFGVCALGFLLLAGLVVPLFVGNGEEGMTSLLPKSHGGSTTSSPSMDQLNETMQELSDSVRTLQGVFQNWKMETPEPGPGIEQPIKAPVQPWVFPPDQWDYVLVESFPRENTNGEVVDFWPSNAQELNWMLAHYTKDGWEPVYVVPHGYYYACLMRQPKK